MVVFESSQGYDALTLTTDDIEERPVLTTWWTRSRYVAVLSVAGCLLTSLAVVTTVSVYWTLNTEALKQNAVNPHFPFPSDSRGQGLGQLVSLHED